MTHRAAGTRRGVVHEFSEIWPIEGLFERAHAPARELADMPRIAVA